MKIHKKNRLKPDVHIMVEPDVQMITAKRLMFSSGIIQYLLINLLIVTSISTGVSYINVRPNYLMILTLSAVLSAVMCFCRSKVVALGAYVAVAVIMYRHLRDIAVGFAVLYTKFYHLYEDQWTGFESVIEQEHSLTYSECITAVLLLYTAILAFILYYSVFLHGNFPLTFLFTFPLAEIGLFNGNVPHYPSAFALLTAWICVFAMQQADHVANKHGKENIFTKSKRSSSFYLTDAKMKNSAFAQITVQTAVITACAVVLAMIGTTLSHYRRSDDLNVIRRNLSREFSYNSLLDALEEIEIIDTNRKGGLNIGGKSSAVSGGMSRGQLRNAYNIKYANNVMISLAFDKPITDSVYLRGYSAGKYTGSSWDTDESIQQSLQDKISCVKAGDLAQYVTDFSTTYDALCDMMSMSFNYVVSYNFTNSPYIDSTNTTTMYITDHTNSGIFFTPYFHQYGSNESYYEDVGVDFADIAVKDYSAEFLPIYRNGSHSSVLSNLSSYGINNAPYAYAYFMYRMGLASSGLMSVEEALDGAILVCGDNPIIFQTAFLGALCQARVQIDSNMFYTRTNATFYSIDNSLPFSQRYIMQLEESGTIREIDLATFCEQLYVDTKEYMKNSDSYYQENIDDGVGQPFIAFSGDAPFTEDYLTYYTESFVYTELAFENYLSVDVNITDTLKDKISTFDDFWNYYEHTTFADYPSYVNQIAQSILKYYNSFYSYSLSVPKTPDDEDFVEYFLYAMDAGSCTYFSSAAIELLRSYGIPARYVEGFLIEGEDISQAELGEDGLYHYDVEDNTAHAWVEIFTSSGWVPFEFTALDRVAQEPEDTTTTTTTTQGTPDTTTTTTTTAQTTLPSGETATTTSANAGDDASSVGSTKPSANRSADYAGLLRTALIVLAIGALLALADFGYVTYRKAVKRRMDDRASTDDENENALYIYNLILRYLRCIGIRTLENVSDIKRAGILCGELEKAGMGQFGERLVSATETAVEAKLGGGTLTAEDTQPMRELLAEIKPAVFERMSKKQQFIARYIEFLY